MLPNGMQWEIYAHAGKIIYKTVKVEGRTYWLDNFGHLCIDLDKKCLTESQVDLVIRAIEAPETLRIEGE